MKIFFDTEFTGLHKNTTLISVGMIDEEGNKCYAEITDYDKSQVNEWIQENVIDNLYLDKLLDLNTSTITDDGTTYIRGTKEYVGKTLRHYLNRYGEIEWVSDVCHYDFVLLIDLIYGHALKMPYGKHCSACHDINQDIAKLYNISEIQAFDKSREGILKDFKIIVEGNKHNSLYDAKVIKSIYDTIKSEENKISYDEVHDFYRHTAKYIYPRLVMFRENPHFYPWNKSTEEWDGILDKMICSFKCAAEDIIANNNYDKVKEGVDLFSEYYLDLWT